VDNLPFLSGWLPVPRQAISVIVQSRYRITKTMHQTARPPESANSDWRSLCRARRIDPVEVEMVASRYVAYRDYMQPHGGGLSLAGWFRFYCQEKASESGTQSGGVVSDCSATGEAIEQNVLSDPQGFLEILRLQIGTLHSA
jgi:hypothetical protein